MTAALSVLRARVNAPLWSIVVLFAISVAIGIGAYLAGTGHTNATASRLDMQARKQDATIGQLRRQLLASCGSAADLGSVPIPDKPLPSRLAIRLVTDNRGQWYGLGCPGTLPVPPGLAKWAGHYGIPVNGRRP